MESPDKIRVRNAYIIDWWSMEIVWIDEQTWTMKLEIKNHEWGITRKTIDFTEFHEMRKLSLNW